MIMGPLIALVSNFGVSFGGPSLEVSKYRLELLSCTDIFGKSFCVDKRAPRLIQFVRLSDPEGIWKGHKTSPATLLASIKLTTGYLPTFESLTIGSDVGAGENGGLGNAIESLVEFMDKHYPLLTEYEVPIVKKVAPGTWRALVWPIPFVQEEDHFFTVRLQGIAYITSEN